MVKKKHTNLAALEGQVQKPEEQKQNISKSETLHIENLKKHLDHIPSQLGASRAQNFPLELHDKNKPRGEKTYKL